MKRILGFSLFVILASLQSVSAHGGEDSKGLSNLQIMLISLAICAVFYLLFGNYLIANQAQTMGFVS